MVRVKIPAKKNVNSLTKKISYWKMPIGIRIMGVPKKTIIHNMLKKRKGLNISQK
jgi:hypothetical protein